jgi:hypothetical protein
MKANNLFYITLTISSFLIINSCTDLQEQILDETTGGSLVTPENLDNLVAPAWGTLRQLYGRDFVWGLQTIPSDECMFPTRGNDWDDGGVWRALHLHTWTPKHARIKGTWDDLMTGIARANYSMQLIRGFEETDAIKEYMTELRLLRAIYNYYIIDLYGQLPIRDYAEIDYSIKPTVLTRSEAFDYIVQEINEIMPELKGKYDVPYGRMNKDIATMLLAKLYLNKEVYTGTPDWDNCISNCETLINSGRYALMSNYWDIFSVNNDQFFNNSSEAIFNVIYNDNEDLGYDANTLFHLNSLHYQQTFGYYSPYNGSVMPPDFVLRFDTANDPRFQSDLVPNLGTNRGILLGLQKQPNGDTIIDATTGLQVSYTLDCPIYAGRLQGARVLKYEPKVPTDEVNRIAYDFVVWRIADVYLMLSEAKIRKGQSGDEELNAVRNIRGLSSISGATLDDILNERGFELYWEGHRRQDLIRFGKFNDAWHEKPETSPIYKIFPIPQTAIDAYDDPDILPQNPGY